MVDRLLSAKIREYAPANPVEQENVLQELMQLYVLASLARAGLFAEAMFHGGTCLRIVCGMNRFSEDLDFLVKKTKVTLCWVRKNMEAAIRRIDWNAARSDVARFLPLREQEGLRAWGADFFLHLLARMNDGET